MIVSGNILKDCYFNSEARHRISTKMHAFQERA